MPSSTWPRPGVFLLALSPNITSAAVGQFFDRHADALLACDAKANPGSTTAVIRDEVSSSGSARYERRHLAGAASAVQRAGVRCGRWLARRGGGLAAISRPAQWGLDESTA